MSKVKVSIGVEERVKYHKYIEMERSDYERLLASLDDGSHKVRGRAEEEIRCYIDPRADFQDADYLEITEFEERK